MNGITTMQSLGSPRDAELRAWIDRGEIPGPRSRLHHCGGTWRLGPHGSRARAARRASCVVVILGRGRREQTVKRVLELAAVQFVQRVRILDAVWHGQHADLC